LQLSNTIACGCLIDDCKHFVVVEARWQQPAAAPVPSLPIPVAYVPRLLDLHVRGPARGRFAPNADVNLPLPPVPPLGAAPRHLPLPPNNLPPSSLPSGVLQPVAGGPASGILPASNVAGVMAPLSVMSAPPHNVTAQPPPLPPFPDMSLISSVPPPPLGHMNVSDVAPLNAKEPLLPLPPSATTSFNPSISLDFVSQSGYYSGYSDQTYHPTESSASFPALQTSVSSGSIRFGVSSSGPGILGVAPAGFEQPGEAKPAQMTKTARDREARAKKKQRKQAMEPLSVESFLGLSASERNIDDNLDKDNEAVQTAYEVKQETEPLAEDQKEDASLTAETTAKVEDNSVSVIIIDDPALPGSETADGDAAVEAKEYHFEWDAMDDEQMSDISVSSVHTSDLSSFDDDIEHAASPNTESENLVSDASPVKDSQLDKSYNDSGHLNLLLLIFPLLVDVDVFLVNTVVAFFIT